MGALVWIDTVNVAATADSLVAAAPQESPGRRSDTRPRLDVLTGDS